MSASPAPSGQGEWQKRPKAALSISALVVVVPIAIGFAAGFAGNLLIARPTSSAERVGRFLVIGLISTVTAWLAERQTRRLAPVAALMRMSLVFPDNAPSRFKVAMRAGVLSKMESRLVDGDGATTYDGVAMSAIAAEMVALVSALRTHDRRTRGHSERVRAYADLIGEELGLSTDERQKLQWGALLHDVGKMAVPAAILNKPGKPDPQEWAILQNHPGASKALLGPLSGWLGPWAAAAWEHHERWDGTGYPNKISRDEITLSGRIVAVADAFEVMTAVRSYKKAIPAAQARAELARCSGSHFDPTVVRAMMAVSVRRLSVVSGPLSWLAQLPFFGWTTSPGGLSVAAFSAGRSAIFASAVGASAVGAVTATAVSTPSSAPPSVVFTIPAMGSPPSVILQSPVSGATQWLTYPPVGSQSGRTYPTTATSAPSQTSPTGSAQATSQSSSTSPSFPTLPTAATPGLSGSAPGPSSSNTGYGGVVSSTAQAAAQAVKTAQAAGQSVGAAVSAAVHGAQMK